MKFFIPLLLLTCSVGLTQPVPGSVLIGGSISYHQTKFQTDLNSDSDPSTRTTTWKVAPQVGFFITPRWIVGGTFISGNTRIEPDKGNVTNKNSLGGGFFSRYCFPTSDFRIGLFLHAEFNYADGPVTFSELGTFDAATNTLSFYPGLSWWFPTRHWVVELAFKGYQRTKSNVSPRDEYALRKYGNQQLSMNCLAPAVTVRYLIKPSNRFEGPVDNVIPGKGSISLGGQILIEKSRYENWEKVSRSLSGFEASLGYFISNRVSVGLSAGISRNHYEDALVDGDPYGEKLIGLYARYHKFSRNSPLGVFAELGISHRDMELGNRDTRVGISPGLIWFFTRNISMELTVSGISYTRRQADNGYQSAENIVEVGGNMFTPSLAIRFYPKNQRAHE